MDVTGIYQIGTLQLTCFLITMILGKKIDKKRPHNYFLRIRFFCVQQYVVFFLLYRISPNLITTYFLIYHIQAACQARVNRSLIDYEREILDLSTKSEMATTSVTREYALIGIGVLCFVSNMCFLKTQKYVLRFIFFSISNINTNTFQQYQSSEISYSEK